MLVKFMGALDIFAAIVILLFQYQMIHNALVLSLGLYLILKAVMFFGDLFSMIDGVIGLYMLFMIILPIEAITFIVVGYLSIKGLGSMF